MNPYQHQTYCSICGGPGVTTRAGLAAEWTGGILQHSNPSECRYYLAEKERKRKEAEEEAKEDKAAQERAKFDADDEYMFEQLEESKNDA